MYLEIATLVKYKTVYLYETCNKNVLNFKSVLPRLVTEVTRTLSTAGSKEEFNDIHLIFEPDDKLSLKNNYLPLEMSDHEYLPPCTSTGSALPL